MTVGNASGVNEGAAPLIIALEAIAKMYGLTPIARILGGTMARAPLCIMCIGPVFVVQRICASLGLKSTGFDVVALNQDSGFGFRALS